MSLLRRPKTIFTLSSHSSKTKAARTKHKYLIDIVLIFFHLELNILWSVDTVTLNVSNAVKLVLIVCTSVLLKIFFSALISQSGKNGGCAGMV
jgi:hypothetical protein